MFIDSSLIFCEVQHQSYTVWWVLMADSSRLLTKVILWDLKWTKHCNKGFLQVLLLLFSLSCFIQLLLHYCDIIIQSSLNINRLLREHSMKICITFLKVLKWIHQHKEHILCIQKSQEESILPLFLHQWLLFRLHILCKNIVTQFLETVVLFIFHNTIYISFFNKRLSQTVYIQANFMSFLFPSVAWWWFHL